MYIPTAGPTDDYETCYDRVLYTMERAENAPRTEQRLRCRTVVKQLSLLQKIFEQMTARTPHNIDQPADIGAFAISGLRLSSLYVIHEQSINGTNENTADLPDEYTEMRGIRRMQQVNLLYTGLWAGTMACRPIDEPDMLETVTDVFAKGQLFSDDMEPISGKDRAFVALSFSDIPNYLSAFQPADQQ